MDEVGRIDQQHWSTTHPELRMQVVSPLSTNLIGREELDEMGIRSNEGGLQSVQRRMNWMSTGQTHNDSRFLQILGACRSVLRTSYALRTSTHLVNTSRGVSAAISPLPATLTTFSFQTRI